MSKSLLGNIAVGFFAFLFFGGLVGLMVFKDNAVQSRLEREYGGYKVTAEVLRYGNSVERYLCEGAPTPTVLANCVNLDSMEFFDWITVNEGMMKLKLKKD